MKININKSLLPVKGHYFLFNAGTAPVVPFLPTLAKQLGFSSFITGTIYTVLPITGILIKPLFGIIADRWQCHKSILIIAQAIVAISLFSFMFIPEIQKSHSVEFTCNEDINNVEYCQFNSKDQCITNKFREHYKNKTLQCNFDCNISNKDYWYTICNSWGILNENDCPYNNETLDMSVSISVDDLQHIGSCLYFTVLEAQINNKSKKFYCPKNHTIFKIACVMKCSEHEYIKEIMDMGVENNEVSKTYQYWMFFLLSVINWSGMAIVVSIADTICFALLGNKPNLYGYQRLWGAIGYGTLSIISGFLVDVWSNSNSSVKKDYTIVFYMALIIILTDAAVSSRLNVHKSKSSTSIFKDIGKLFLKARIIIFFLWCIIAGLCTALVWNYLFWYLEELANKEENCNSIKYMKTLQGLVMTIQSFGGELPFLFLSKWILKNIGHINSMSIVLAAFSIRFILYFTLTNPWWALPIEFIHGFTYGIFYAAMASYASIIAPPGTEATLQGLIGAIFEGVGVSLGSLLGGLLFEIIGGGKTFLLYGIISLVACIVHVILQKILEIYEKKHGEQKINEDE